MERPTTRPRLFLSAALSTPADRSRNLQLATELEALVDVYLPQRDGGLLADMVVAGVAWHDAAALVKRRDIEALRASDLIVAVLGDSLVGAGVAFELGVADALGIPCWSLIIGGRRNVKSPIIESAVARRFESSEALLGEIADYAARFGSPT